MEKQIDSIFNPEYDYKKNAKITKSFFDFFLHDISSKEMEEKFVNLCEKFLCDEMGLKLEKIKEDVSENEANKIGVKALYYGQESDLSTIAFRIYTRSNWEKQYETDMKTFADYDDGNFSKLYFITNQEIVPKIIFNNEIKYLNSKKIEAHLIDRKWIIDKIFEQENYMKLAMEVFELSDELVYDGELEEDASIEPIYLDELKDINELFMGHISAIDEASKTEGAAMPEVNWKELNEKLNNAFIIIKKMYSRDDVSSEDKKNQMYEYIAKYKMILDALAEPMQKVEFVFNTSWYMAFNEYDGSILYDYALELGELLKETNNAILFEKCVILWVLTRKNGMDTKDTKALLDILSDVYNDFAQSDVDPNDKMQVAFAYTFLSLYTKAEKETTLDDFLTDIAHVATLENVDVYKFAIMFMEDKNFYTSSAERIENCIEIIIKALKNRGIGPIDIGRIWYKQAKDVARSNEVVGATYYKNALRCFESDEDGGYLEAKVLYELGKMYDKKKMFWLSRAAFMDGIAICIRLYKKEGISSKLFLDFATEMKNVELALGRIMYSTRFNYLEEIIRGINREEQPKSDKSEDTYDFMLAVLIYKTPLIKLEQIGRVSRYFERHGLYYSNIAVKHELGHYDKKLLSALENNKKIFDEYVAKWKQQPVKGKAENIEPWYGVEYKGHFKTDVMGCEVEIDIENKAIAIEYATLLNAALQAVLYDASPTETQLNRLKIYVLCDKESMFNISVSDSGDEDTQFVVKIGRFSHDNMISQQEMLKAHIKEFIPAILNTIFRYKTSFNKMKTIVDSKEYSERVAIIAESFVNSLDTFGFTTFSYNTLTAGYDNILSKRSIDDVFPNQNLSKKIQGLKKRLRATFEQSELIKEKIMTKVIDVDLWDKAEWETVMIPNKAGNLPMLGFVFKKEEGKKIFDNWIDMYGHEDKINYIGIRVLKKVDAAEPFKFRVVVGNTRKIFYEDDGTEIETPVYTCTVSAENVAYLYTFEKLLKNKTDFVICPATISGDGKVHYDEERKIVKKFNSIRIFNVWEIDMKDNLSIEGVFSTDTPVLPHGEDSVALVQLIEEKKRKVDVLTAALSMSEE